MIAAHVIALKNTALTLNWTAIGGCFIIVIVAILAVFLIGKK